MAKAFHYLRKEAQSLEWSLIFISQFGKIYKLIIPLPTSLFRPTAFSRTRVQKKQTPALVDLGDINWGLDLRKTRLADPGLPYGPAYIVV